MTCQYTISGCSYPQGECSGACMTDQGRESQHLIRDHLASQQPEALRLADLIERYNSGVHSQAIVEDYCKAAAELRRLHTENEVIRHSSGRVGRRLERTSDALMEARAQRDELLEALHLALEYWAHREQRYKNRSPVWVQKSREAIAKAGGAA